MEFPLVNILHDRKRTDRYELFTQQAQEQGFQYKIWDACHDTGKPKLDINICHKKIIQYAKDNQLEEVITMEDDAKFTAPDSFRYFLSKKPEIFDLYLAGIISGRINPDNTLNDPCGFQLFICHSRYYDKFLASDPNKDIDRAQFDKQWKVPRGLFYVCNPFAVVQAETFSDNTKRVHLHKRLYKDRQLYAG